jgi:hypothetical protein
MKILRIIPNLFVLAKPRMFISVLPVRNRLSWQIRLGLPHCRDSVEITFERDGCRKLSSFYSAQNATCNTNRRTFEKFTVILFLYSTHWFFFIVPKPSSCSYPFPTLSGVSATCFSSRCDKDSAIIFTTGRLPDVNPTWNWSEC